MSWLNFLIFLSGFFSLVWILYRKLRSPFDYWRKLGVKQGNPMIFFGDSFKLATLQFSKAGMMEYVYKMFPNERYSGFYQFYNPTLLIRDPELIKLITVKDFDHFTDHRPLFYEDPHSPWSRNLFTLTGKKWRDMRATLSPSFTSSKMKFLFGLINKTAENFVDHFKNLHQKEIELELKETFRRFTNDVIASSAFGVQVDTLKDDKNQFYLFGKEATSFASLSRAFKFFGFMFFPNFFKMFNISFFNKSVNDFFLKLIRDTIKVREEKNIIRPDMLHLLMQARKENQKTEFDGKLDQESKTVNGSVKTISDFDIAAQAMVFYFAGLESVSGLMSFAGYELAVNPEVQNRLREEIRETLKACNGALTYEALFQMKYLDMVVSETLRKWPSAVGTDRVSVKPYTIKATGSEEQDFEVPVDTTICISFFGLHRDPKYYPNPERFDPERFSDENKSKLNPYAYLPFGVGPRNCIGNRFALMETKIVIFHLINDFEIVPCEKSTIPAKISSRSFTLMAKDGFWFKLRRLG